MTCEELTEKSAGWQSDLDVCTVLPRTVDCARLDEEGANTDMFAVEQIKMEIIVGDANFLFGRMIICPRVCVPYCQLCGIHFEGGWFPNENIHKRCSSN